MLRILIVDDTRSVQSFVKSILSKFNEIETVSVYNGQEAIDFLEKDSRFDLVLLDWEMPVKTGPETFDEFKKRGFTVPTMMMTTKNSPNDIQKMLDMGVSEYLMKPFTADILFEKIEFVTGRRVLYVA